MADELTVLQRQRRGNIGYVKRIIADSNKLLADQNIDDEEKEASLLANKDSFFFAIKGTLSKKFTERYLRS